MKKLFLFLTLLALTFSLSSVANATLCSLSDVTTSTHCSDGTTSNDVSGDLNSLNYFGHNDWEYLSKRETPGDLEESVDIDLVVSPTTGTNTGAWSFNSDTWNNYNHIVIILKDGQVEGIKWFAYLLEDECSSGKWKYPGTHDLSYLAVYGSKGDVPVPEPATILLFGSGLVGLASFGRKKVKK